MVNQPCVCKDVEIKKKAVLANFCNLSGPPPMKAESLPKMYEVKLLILCTSLPESTANGPIQNNKYKTLLEKSCSI